MVQVLKLEMSMGVNEEPRDMTTSVGERSCENIVNNVHVCSIHPCPYERTHTHTVMITCCS